VQRLLFQTVSDQLKHYHRLISLTGIVRRAEDLPPVLNAEDANHIRRLELSHPKEIAFIKALSVSKTQ
jgi:hypothetical protein